MHSFIEQKAVLMRLLSSLEEGVVDLDAELKVLSVNPAALKILGKTEEELLARFFPECISTACAKLVHKCQTTHAAVEQLSLKGHKSTSYFDISVIPKEEGKGVVVLLRDKSQDHKLLEMGKAFIANASHELKTPITIIQGFAEMLHEHKLEPAQEKEITSKIVSNCQRMNTLVKNLLTLADATDLPMSRLQKTDLCAIIDRCIDMVRVVHPKAQVVCKGERPLYLIADADLLELAITNLLVNAARYSRGDPEICVKTQTENNTAVLHVSDKGIGIPQKELELIFQRFYTVDKAHSRRLGGSGLGLSIVQTIVEKHRGKVQVESKLGAGSTFSLILPLSQAL